MGEDKSLLPFREYSTLIEYQYNKLSKIFSKVYVSSKTNKFDFTSNLILDIQNISSPMVALEAILQNFDNKVFIITVDSPLVHKDTILELINQSWQSDITVAVESNKTHNLLGVFSKDLLKNINNYICENMHKINILLKNSNTKYVEFEESHQFINVNTQFDYQKLIDIHKLHLLNC